MRRFLYNVFSARREMGRGRAEVRRPKSHRTSVLEQPERISGERLEQIPFSLLLFLPLPHDVARSTVVQRAPFAIDRSRSANTNHFEFLR